MHTDGKIEDQGNAIQDLKGVADCCVSIIFATTVSGGQSQRMVKNILQQK